MPSFQSIIQNNRITAQVNELVTALNVARSEAMMARTFLRHIRVTSKAELQERILKGIAEFNEVPVPFRWKKFYLRLA